MIKTIPLFFLLLLFIFPIVQGKPDDVFINYVFEMIEKDCYGQDIQIKEGFIKTTSTDEPVTLIYWDTNGHPFLYRVLEILSEKEPYDDYFNGCDTKRTRDENGDRQEGMTHGLDGCNILTCGEHYLDINRYDYFWDSVRITLSREEYLTIMGDKVDISGSQNQYAKGRNISQYSTNTTWIWDWRSGFIGGIIGSVISGVLVALIMKKIEKKSKKK